MLAIVAAIRIVKHRIVVKVCGRGGDERVGGVSLKPPISHSGLLLLETPPYGL
jgi:hypothetical protein